MSITVRCGSHCLPAVPGETLLSALVRAGLPAPYSCEQGNCGTCRIRLVDGDVLELPHTEFALSALERSRGVVLACRTQVWGDASVSLLDRENFPVHPLRSVRCRVAALDDLTHDIRRVRMEVESGGPLRYFAGQYAQLWLGDLAPRDYSFASMPDEPWLDFHVRFVPHGASSRYVFERMTVGERLRVDGPKGTAFLRESYTEPIIAIAGGSGLAPIRSIVLTALARGMRRPVHVYAGVREERDVYLEDEFAELTARHDNLHVHYVLSEGTPGGARRTGPVTAAVAEDFATLQGWRAYLAGPPVMVETAFGMLMERGLSRHDIHADAYYTAADKPGGLGR